MLGRGWSVRLKRPGVTNADGVTPDRTGRRFVYAQSVPMRMLIGGRLLLAPPTRRHRHARRKPLAEWTVVREPNWFVQWIRLAEWRPRRIEPCASLA